MIKTLNIILLLALIFVGCEDLFSDYTAYGCLDLNACNYSSTANTSGLDLCEYPDENFPTMDEGRYAGVIGVGGLLLARIPEEIALQIDEYYKKQNEAKEEAVNNDLMKEQHPSMKFQKESNTRVTFGGTKKS